MWFRGFAIFDNGILDDSVRLVTLPKPIHVVAVDNTFSNWLAFTHTYARAWLSVCIVETWKHVLIHWRQVKCHLWMNCFMAWWVCLPPGPLNLRDTSRHPQPWPACLTKRPWNIRKTTEAPDERYYALPTQWINQGRRTDVKMLLCMEEIREHEVS